MSGCCPCAIDGHCCASHEDRTEEVKNWILKNFIPKAEIERLCGEMKFENWQSGCCGCNIESECKKVIQDLLKKIKNE